MFLIVHEKLFLLQVILIGSSLFTISISKFQSKNWLQMEEQKKEPIEIIHLNLDSPVSPEITIFWV